MKRLLFISPDYYDFHSVILKGFQKYSDYEVTMVITNTTYRYKNVFERINNFFSKIFLKKNLKKIKQEKLISDLISQNNEYEIAFVNRPDMLSQKVFDLIQNICKTKITYYWDSFNKIRGQKETIQYFDKCYSFDVNDCERYNLTPLHNFYFDQSTSEKIKYDVLFLGTFDKRFTTVKSITNSLVDQGLNATSILLDFNKQNHAIYSSDCIQFIDKIIPFEKSIQYSLQSKMILDIHHDNQIGLSFRPFEAMGLRKKLITTNQHIKDYDFYNPNNIFIWNDSTKQIPNTFLTTPYQELPKEILTKYSLENWVSKILKS